MKEIKLFNRDGANLRIKKIKDIGSNISEWKLDVDKEHQYCLEYLRIIGNYPKEIEAVDPSGGPMISLADEFEGKYKIIKIIGPTLFWISERNSNNQEHSK